MGLRVLRVPPLDPLPSSAVSVATSAAASRSEIESWTANRSTRSSNRSPQTGSAGGDADELNGDADPLAQPLDRALQDHVDPETPAGGDGVGGAAG